MAENVIFLFKDADGGDHFLCGVEEGAREVDNSGADFFDAIGDQAAGGGVGEIEDVVDFAGKLVDVFAVERSDEGSIQLLEQIVGDGVVGVLDVLDFFGGGGGIREIFQHGDHGLGGYVNVFGELHEHVVEAFFARQKLAEQSGHGSESILLLLELLRRPTIPEGNRSGKEVAERPYLNCGVFALKRRGAKYQRSDARVNSAAGRPSQRRILIT